jgi:hypothetical protein
VEVFLFGLIKLNQLNIPTPHYTTLCQRGKTLKVDLGIKPRGLPRHILINSTGVQVLGEGEWKRLKHGESRCQVWKKLHIALDADSLDIVALSVTDSVRLDCNYLPALIEEIKDPIEQITDSIGAVVLNSPYRVSCIFNHVFFNFIRADRCRLINLCLD